MKKDNKIYMIPHKKPFAQKDILNLLPLTLTFIEGGERGSKESSPDIRKNPEAKYVAIFVQCSIFNLIWNG